MWGSVDDCTEKCDGVWGKVRTDVGGSVLGLPIPPPTLPHISHQLPHTPTYFPTPPPNIPHTSLHIFSHLQLHPNRLTTSGSPVGVVEVWCDESSGNPLRSDGRDKPSVLKQQR